jgi:hypothetical protein
MEVVSIVRKANLFLAVLRGLRKNVAALSFAREGIHREGGRERLVRWIINQARNYALEAITRQSLENIRRCFKQKI